MKTAVLLLALSASLHAGEASRTWTRSDGKTLTGALRSKTDTHAGILLATGKRVEVELKSLTLDDRNYVKTATLFPDPTLAVHAVMAQNRDAEKGEPEIRELTVKVDRLHDRQHEVVVLWLGDGGDKRDYGIFRAEQRDVPKDGALTFQCSFRPGRSIASLGRNYRGYVVALRGKIENQVTPWYITEASQKPYLRFLSEDWEPKLKVRGD